MLYQINKTTWLDLPKWKCRREFAELWSAKREHPTDIELINRLKAQCDEIERTHFKRSGRNKPNLKRAGGIVTKRSRPVNVYDYEGRYLATYPNAHNAARDLFGDNYKNAAGKLEAILAGRDRLKSYKGYRIRYDNGVYNDIKI